MCIRMSVCVMARDLSCVMADVLSSCVFNHLSNVFIYFSKIISYFFVYSKLFDMHWRVFIYLFIYLKLFYMYLPEFICLFSMLIFIYSILLYILFIYIYLLKVIFIFISTFMHVKYLLFFCSKLLLICFAKIISY